MALAHLRPGAVRNGLPRPSARMPRPLLRGGGGRRGPVVGQGDPLDGGGGVIDPWGERGGCRGDPPAAAAPTGAGAYGAGGAAQEAASRVGGARLAATRAAARAAACAAAAAPGLARGRPGGGEGSGGCRARAVGSVGWHRRPLGAAASHPSRGGAPAPGPVPGPVCCELLHHPPRLLHILRQRLPQPRGVHHARRRGRQDGLKVGAGGPAGTPGGVRLKACNGEAAVGRAGGGGRGRGRGSRRGGAPRGHAGGEAAGGAEADGGEGGGGEGPGGGRGVLRLGEGANRRRRR